MIDVSGSLAIAAVSAAPVVVPAHPALTVTIVTFAGIGADRRTRRAANDRADRGAFRAPRHSTSDDGTGTGADNRTTHGVLGIGAARNGCERSQSHGSKNCLAH